MVIWLSKMMRGEIGCPVILGQVRSCVTSYLHEVGSSIRVVIYLNKDQIMVSDEDGQAELRER